MGVTVTIFAIMFMIIGYCARFTQEGVQQRRERRNQESVWRAPLSKRVLARRQKLESRQRVATLTAHFRGPAA